jgi:hypothetical protein
MLTTKTTNTTAGYARTATSRSAPRRSGRVFLHTATKEDCRKVDHMTITFETTPIDIREGNEIKRHYPSSAKDAESAVRAKLPGSTQMK